MSKKRRQKTQRVSIPRSVRGYAVKGPGFFVWDEDARVVELAGEELLRAIEARRRVRHRRRVRRFELEPGC